MTQSLSSSGSSLSAGPLEELADKQTVELRTDELHRRLYAQDASIYEEQPLGVAYPRDAAELESLVEMAGQFEIPLIPRGGGTSLAGQCVGRGLVVDFGRHMNDVLEIDPEARQVRVQPGVVLEELNRRLEPHGLMFGPDTSTANRCQIGGMIGNNSCGSHSVYYGTTRQNIDSLELLLVDGTRVEVGEWGDEQFEEALERDDRLGEGLRAIEEAVDTHDDLIRERFPDPSMIRRNTGYPLDDVLDRRPFAAEGEPFSLARFLCGTEGTLGFVTEATLDLVERPGAKRLVCSHFDSLRESLEATRVAVEHGPAAAELFDDRVLELARGQPEQRKNRFFVEGDPRAILVVEFYGDDEAAVERKADELEAEFEEADLGYAHPRVEPPKDERVWALRKAGLGILMGLKGDRKPVTVVEDTAVDVDVLPDYIDDFGGVMEEHGTQCVYYAHASVGELHLRPELNLKDPADADTFEAIAHDVTDLVREYDGALSGEHGDGRLRAPMHEEFFGEELVGAFESIKEAFDPKGVLNPGTIVDPPEIDEDWRVEPGESIPEVETVFDWSDDEGLLRAVEKCNGAGACRKKAEAGGTMCPSYHATLEERDTTRGRANVFRQLLRSEDPNDAFSDDVLEETLDLCLSCKACQTECPASVDMARMKAEFSQQRYDREGVPRSAAFFGRYRDYAWWASWWPALANFLAAFALTRAIMNWWYDLAPERQLPTFETRTFSRRFADHESRFADREAPFGVVWLYVDPFTEFNEPEIGMAAVRVLEDAGYRVERLPIDDDGRTLISKGLVREARELSENNLRKLEPLLEEHPDRPVVGLEPSALLTFRDELPDLVDDALGDVADDLGERSMLFGQFVRQASLEGEFGAEWEKPDAESVALHGHCHQEALAGTEATEVALELAGYEVDTIPSGCCGMAGSFGYEADHYEVSMEIGEQILFPALREAPDDRWVAAPGTSCRHQIADGVDRSAEHPAVLMERALQG